MPAGKRASGLKSSGTNEEKAGGVTGVKLWPAGGRRPADEGPPPVSKGTARRAEAGGVVQPF